MHDYQDDSTPITEVLSETTPVAREDYVCTICGGKIPAGTKHRKVTGISDGAFFSDRTHLAPYGRGAMLGDCELKEPFAN